MSLRFGKWTVVSPGQLGAGGMAQVFAVQHDDGRTGALKKRSREDADTVARFGIETELLEKLAGLPHVPALLDASEVEAGWFVMARKDGVTLYDHWRAAAAADRTPARADAMLLKVAAALRDAHGRGVFHRDLKARNVFLTPHELFIFDWGSGIALAAAARHTRTGETPPRTPEYHPPDAHEMERERNKSGWESWDVFQLGRIYEWMLTGGFSGTGSLKLGNVARWRSDLWRGMIRPWRPAVEPGRLTLDEILDHAQLNNRAARDEGIVDPSEARPPVADHTVPVPDEPGPAPRTWADPPPSGSGTHPAPVAPRRGSAAVTAAATFGATAAVVTIAALVGVAAWQWPRKDEGVGAGEQAQEQEQRQQHDGGGLTAGVPDPVEETGPATGNTSAVPHEGETVQALKVEPVPPPRVEEIKVPAEKPNPRADRPQVETKRTEAVVERAPPDPRDRIPLEQRTFTNPEWITLLPSGDVEELARRYRAERRARGEELEPLDHHPGLEAALTRKRPPLECETNLEVWSMVLPDDKVVVAKCAECNVQLAGRTDAYGDSGSCSKAGHAWLDNHCKHRLVQYCP